MFTQFRHANEVQQHFDQRKNETISDLIKSQFEQLLQAQLQHPNHLAHTRATNVAKCENYIVKCCKRKTMTILISVSPFGMQKGLFWRTGPGVSVFCVTVCHRAFGEVQFLFDYVRR